jgi:hypothetical protein
MAAVDLSKVSTSDLAREMARRRVGIIRAKAAAEAVAAERARVAREAKRQARKPAAR